MSRIAYCQACNMIRHGVRSRIALEHSCGLERGAIPEDMVKPMRSYPPIVYVKNPYIDEIIKNAHTMKEVFVIKLKGRVQKATWAPLTMAEMYYVDDFRASESILDAHLFHTYDMALVEMKKHAESDIFYQIEKHYVKK